jgi:hypothetical protein
LFAHLFVVFDDLNFMNLVSDMFDESFGCKKTPQTAASDRFDTEERTTNRLLWNHRVFFDEHPAGFDRNISGCPIIDEEDLEVSVCVGTADDFSSTPFFANECHDSHPNQNLSRSQSEAI